MPRRILVVPFLLACVVSAAAQNSGTAVANPQRAPSAIAFLSQGVSTAGGSSAIGAVQDFTAQGSITHFWDQQEQGQLTVKSRGLLQFRIDSVLPEGTWSYIVTNSTGEYAFPNRAVVTLASHNTLNVGALTLPICTVYAALMDPTTTVLDLGTVKFGSGLARQVRIQRSVAGNSTVALSKLAQRDYFFDPTSAMLLETQDFAHPPDDAVNGTLMHVLDFGNYQNVNGILVPFSVTETLNGQQTWTLQVSAIAFNTSLSDQDFQF